MIHFQLLKLQVKSLLVGNSSTSLISGLQPDDRKGNPTFNNKEHDGYGATNPFFHFTGQTGSDNQLDIDIHTQQIGLDIVFQYVTG